MGYWGSIIAVLISNFLYFGPVMTIVVVFFLAESNILVTIWTGTCITHPIEQGVIIGLLASDGPQLRVNVLPN